METRSIRRNAVLSVIRQVCSIVFPLITFPYITRTIGSENYGKLGFISSIVTYLFLIAVLGRNVYAVREGAKLRDCKEKFVLFGSQVYTINVITTVIAYCILLVLYLCWPKLRNYSALLLIYGITIVAGTIGKEWINTVFEDYERVTIRYIAFQILSIILVFAIVKQQNDYILYASIVVLASTGPQFLNYFYVKKFGDIHVLFKNVEMQKHLSPMFVLFSSAIATTLYTNSDITLIGVFLNDFKTGQYSFSVSIYTMVKVAINAVIAVFVPRVSNLLGNKRTAEYNALLKTGFFLIMMLAIPSAVGLFMVSKEVTFLFGGLGYEEAVSSLKILCVSIPFTTLANFLNNVILIPNQEERYSLKTVIAGAVLNISLNLFSIPFLGIYGAAITTLIAEMFAFACFWNRGRHHCDGLVDVNNLKSIIIPSSLIIVCCKVAGCFFSGVALLAVSVTSSVVVFAFSAMFLNNPLLKRNREVSRFE